jgi:hypothetical protein
MWDVCARRCGEGGWRARGREFAGCWWAVSEEAVGEEAYFCCRCRSVDGAGFVDKRLTASEAQALRSVIDTLAFCATRLASQCVTQCLSIFPIIYISVYFIQDFQY